jgi:phosphoribosylformylglycinamidine synthase
MMPHPERVVDAAQGGTDGSVLFRSVLGAVLPA